MEESPVVNQVDALLRTAISRSASDVHIEPTDKGLRIRFRIDGVLHNHVMLDPSIMKQFISRLKVLSHINVAESRIPQDGKFIFNINGQAIDLRVSTFPCLYGEKVVVRILDRSRIMISLDQLGFYDKMLKRFRSLICKPSGFLLVTGPTGSGKTTTLYSALSSLNTIEKNIITLEDPVEYYLDGITQGQINPHAGFSFEKGMRALLRQDPDSVMVGEIRDMQTARIAIQAALTGHFVMSTLHTNDALTVIMRLMDMGIEPFLINAALSGVLAQRLARKICIVCRTQVLPTPEEQELLKRLGAAFDQLYKGSGCDSCDMLGYKGRVGIFELLVMDDTVRSLIVHSPSLDALYVQARKNGMLFLIDDGMQKVRDGIITLDELMRVVA